MRVIATPSFLTVGRPDIVDYSIAARLPGWNLERYAQDMGEFVSESITPWPGTSDAAAMGRAEPGLPRGFDWRDQPHEISETLERWKQSGADMGELYLRRHYFRLRMSDGSVWTVYCLRQSPRSGSGKRRWFLLEIG